MTASDTPIAARIRENVARVQENIATAAARSNRSADQIKLVGVTKYVEPPIAKLLVEARVIHLGESRPQELWRKAETLADLKISWHLIGHLQRNKIERTLPLVHASAVQKGAPLDVDYDEPRRVAEAAAAMGLRHAVVTSVNRDDRKDGGAELFALTIRAIRERVDGCRVEVLVPDFQGSHAAMETVMEARPDVLNHNTETVPRLYRQARPGSDYAHSLALLRDLRRIG
jgi:hypothetical protein